MHNINASNKKARTIRLFVSYFVIAIMLISMTSVLVLVAAGYDIDRKTGKVIQNGVLLLESSPEEADVYINGKLESDKTPSRFALPQGSYEVSMEFDGYRGWKSQVAIRGSQVSWLYYPLMIPNQIETDAIHSLGKLAFIELNDEADEIVSYSTNNINTLSFYDIGDDEIVPDNIELPLALFKKDDSNQPVGSLSFVEWSSDAAYIILKYTYNNETDYWVVDRRSPNKTKSIDSSIGINVNDAFFGSKNNKVYVRSGSLLREYSISNASVGNVLFDGLDDYGVEDKSIWIQRVGSDDKLNGIFNIEDPEEPVIQYEQSDRKTLLASNYESKSNLAIVGDDVIELYTDVTNKLLASVPEKIIKFNDPNAKIEFSTHGRFISVTQSNKTTVYDLETQRDYKFTVDSSGVLGWFDASRFYYSKDSVLHIVDFTGENKYDIVSYDPKFRAFINRDRNSIFTVFKNDKGTLQLRRSVINLE